MLKDGSWCEAGNLPRDAVLRVGVDPPLVGTCGHSPAWRVDAVRDALGYELNVTTRLHKTLAFFRLLGYIMGDGHLSGRDSEGTIYLGHELDIAAVQRDFRLLVPDAVAGRQRRMINNTYRVTVPAQLVLAFLALGVQPGDRWKKGWKFPELLFAEGANPDPSDPLMAAAAPSLPLCPLVVVRAFLSGLFGSDGHTLTLQNQNQLRGLAWSSTVRGAVSMEHAAEVKKLGALLQRCGVSAEDFRWEKPHTKATTVSKAGKEEVARLKKAGEKLGVNLVLADVREDQSVTFKIILNRGAVATFAKEIGFAYWSVLARLRHD
jgi:hypothetical protein